MENTNYSAIEITETIILECEIIMSVNLITINVLLKKKWEIH